MAYVEMELVKGPELRSIIEALHGSGLLAEPIDLKKGRRIANLAGDFVEGIEAINAAGSLDNVPEAVFNYYTTIVKEGDPPDKAAKEKAKAEAKAKKKAAAEAKKKAKAEEAAAKKKEEEAAAEEAAAKEAATEAEADKINTALEEDERKKAEEAKKKAAAKKAAPAKKPPAKKATAKKTPAKKSAKLVKSAIFGKLLLSKKTKKWDVKELVEALAAKTESPYVDTRRKCNTYIALLRTMSVLEDAGDKLVMAEWYRKALANK